MPIHNRSTTSLLHCPSLRSRCSRQCHVVFRERSALHIIYTRFTVHGSSIRLDGWSVGRSVGLRHPTTRYQRRITTGWSPTRGKTWMNDNKGELRRSDYWTPRSQVVNLDEKILREANWEALIRRDGTRFRTVLSIATAGFRCFVLSVYDTCVIWTTCRLHGPVELPQLACVMG